MKRVDRETYADLIAGYMVGVAAAKTYSGNYCIYFEEIDEMFDTDLAHDEEMVEFIKESISNRGEIVADVNLYTSTFDIMIYTSFCPLLDEEA